MEFRISHSLLMSLAERGTCSSSREPAHVCSKQSPEECEQCKKSPAEHQPGCTTPARADPKALHPPQTAALQHSRCLSTALSDKLLTPSSPSQILFQLISKNLKGGRKELMVSTLIPTSYSTCKGLCQISAPLLGI